MGGEDNFSRQNVPKKECTFEKIKKSYAKNVGKIVLRPQVPEWKNSNIGSYTVSTSRQTNEKVLDTWDWETEPTNKNYFVFQYFFHGPLIFPIVL